MSEPNPFWVDTLNEGPLKVIEYSAYESTLAAIAHLREVLEKVDRITKSKEFTSVFYIAQIHHAQYQGEQFGEDIAHALSATSGFGP